MPVSKYQYHVVKVKTCHKTYTTISLNPELIAIVEQKLGTKSKVRKQIGELAQQDPQGLPLSRHVANGLLNTLNLPA